MSDGSGTTPDRSRSPEEAAIPPADAVIPPPPPEIPVPDGLLNPPPSEIPVADAVIPPPPPEVRLRSAERPRPTILDGDQPSVAPAVPTSGGYRGLTVAIFAFLLLLLVGAVVLGIYLLSTGSFPFLADDDSVAGPLLLTPLF